MEECKYLIIGNGISSLAAIREIRKRDKTGTINVVSSEGVLTYYRTKLTEYIAKDFKDEELLVVDEDWYRENKINLFLGKIVEKIETENNRVVLDDSVEIEYERLLIATGSKPFIPPITGKYKEGVFAIRTIKDLHYMKNYIRDRDKITVVGGGLLGLEAAWSFKKLGKQVNIVEFAPYLLPRQVDEEISKKLYKSLEKEGFKIYLGAETQEIHGDVRVDRISLKDGQIIDSDAVIISVGIRPNIDLIRDTDIEFDRGMIVDKHLQTNIDNIYGAGDLVEIDKKVFGLWTVSNAQGKVAGANMAGGDEKFVEANIFTNLQIGDVKLFSAGKIDDYDSLYEYKDGDKHHKIFAKQGKIQGAILFGELKKMNKIRNAVVSNMDIKEYIDKDEDFKLIE